MRQSTRPFRFLVIGWLIVVTVIITLSLISPSPVL